MRHINSITCHSKIKSSNVLMVGSWRHVHEWWPHRSFNFIMCVEFLIVHQKAKALGAGLSEGYPDSGPEWCINFIPGNSIKYFRRAEASSCFSVEKAVRICHSSSWRHIWEIWLSRGTASQLQLQFLNKELRYLSNIKLKFTHRKFATWANAHKMLLLIRFYTCEFNIYLERQN